MHPEVLLIDDDAIFMMFFKRMIIKSGISQDPIIFRNGLDAYEYIKDRCEENKDFILFLDINMPLMNGWQFLEKVSENCSVKNLTTFMVSSSTDESDISKAKNYSWVKDFLIKPVMQDDLEKIRNSPEIAAFYS
jgi:two-component SAPR family response regulator